MSPNWMVTGASWIVLFWHYVVSASRVLLPRKACSTMDGLQLLFTLLISVQFVVIVQRDQLDIPGWTKGTEVGEAVGRKKLVWPR